MTAASAGLLTGLSVIVAVGAQNAYVLRQGLLRSHVGVVVLFCALSDLVLISLGVGGVGAVVDRAGWLLEVVRWGGVVFLVTYGVMCLRRATRRTSLTAAGGEEVTRGGALGRAAALTWLNPHLYVDIAIYGVLANSYGPDGRWTFAVGLIAASMAWFAALGYGARLLSPVLATPRAWQVLDVVIGLTMLAIATKLALG
ncbi:LysE/ArgO family amino acid transporter [Nocardioides insulae]|uniref:LysE/ArgO family amino acid transporter n=1 Tax=Nocardioides insulae TaxID=394734 RepID=UPI00040B2926|nr:LysE family transporter [Nocardioides insulae]